jgi:hypothetical protein
MSATPESTLADPQQIIADIKHELVECRAQRDKAQQNFDEKTSELDEALAQGGPRRRLVAYFFRSPRIVVETCQPFSFIPTVSTCCLIFANPAFDAFF